MKIPKGSTAWAGMTGRFRNTNCGICSHSISATKIPCQQDKCLVSISRSQHTLIANLIKILEIE